MAYTQKKGNEAEDIAAGYLASKGYKIRNRNWRHYNKEIDIIAEKDGKVIIVEVKSCAEPDVDRCLELLTLSKMRNLTDAGDAYMCQLDEMKEVQFDYLVVVRDVLGIKIKHIPEAFIPGVNW